MVVDQPIAEITTEKAVVEVPTPFAGRVATLHGAEGETITVGKPLISIEVAGAPADGGVGQRPGRLRNQRGGAAVAAERPPARRRVRRRPRTRRDAAGLAAGATARGGARHRPQHDRRQRTGRHGDPGRPRACARQDGAAPAPGSAAPTIAGGERMALTGVDRIAAERLTRSHHEAPTRDRVAQRRRNPAHGVARGARTPDRPMPRSHPSRIILRLCVSRSGNFPGSTRISTPQANEIVRFTPIHLGVAVQTDRGLVVAVIRDAQSKSLRGDRR